jgi:HK97 family phage prohead protease
MAIVRKQVGLQVKAAGLQGRQLKFVISTDRVDRAGDTIDQSGWQLADFKANPVITWGHQYDIPPIARAVQIGLEGGQLTSVAEFPEPGIYPLADQVYGLAKAGFINAASVGFEPLQWTFNAARGPFARDYKQQALYEWAVVSIPSNPDTLIQARSQGLTWPEHGGPMRDRDEERFGFCRNFHVRPFEV